MKTEILANLRRVLAILYPDVVSIRRVIKDSDLTLSRIELNSSAENNWYAVLDEADKLGQIETLLCVVEEEYRPNQDLRTACVAYRQAVLPIVPAHDQTRGYKAAHQGDQPLMNCVHEIAAFHELLENGSTTQRAIVLQGGHGCGKTRLLTEYRRLADQLGRKVVQFDLGKQNSIEQCLERIGDNCADPSRFTAFEQSLRKKKPESLSRQAAWHEELTHAFFTDLRAQRTAVPIFVFFDHVEKADQLLRNWLLDKFVTRLADRPLQAVLAGHAELDRVQHLEWVRFFTPRIPQIEHFYEYAERFEVQLEPTVMTGLFMAFQATPKSFVDYVDAMRLQQRGQPA